MKKLLFAAFAVIASINAFAQPKKKIDHTTYDEWKTIRTVVQSPKGKFIAYEVAPLEGDAMLVFRTVENSSDRQFARGKGLFFLADESAAIFLVEPEFDTIRQLKLDEVSKDKFPKDSLFIYYPALDSVVSFANVKSFYVPETGYTVAYQMTKDTRPECPELKKKKKKKKDQCSKPATSGTTLVLFNTQSGKRIEFHRVTTYSFSEDGSKLLYVQSLKGKKDTLSLSLYNLIDSTNTVLIDQQFAIQQACFSKKADQVAFLASADTNKLKSFSLYYHSIPFDLTGSIVDSMNNAMPKGWNVSEYGRVYFSNDGQRLYFSTNEIVQQEPEDTLLETEKATVDIWGTNDKRIQPQQLTELNQDKKRSYPAVFHTGPKTMVQLTNAEVYEVNIDKDNSAQRILASSDLTYQREFSWEYPWRSNYFLIDQNSGDIVALADSIGFSRTLSPSASHFAYYKGEDSCWYAINCVTLQEINLSGHLSDLFATDNNGNPSLADDEGYVGWWKHNNQEWLIVNSRYDIWALNPQDPKASFSLTNTSGKTEKVKFNYYQLDDDSLYTTPENNYLIGVDEQTKRETIYSLTITNDKPTLNELLATDHRISLIKRADESDQIILRRMSFTHYPDLELTNTSFENPIQFSDINPQQKEYNWGTVEFVSWKTYEGRNLRGLLYKPEDFDSTKSYPMIVYYYEKYTQDYHLYYAPKPTASIVYPTEYVSNGYIIFIPDIEYTPGYPARSAYDCIMSGTDHIIRNYHYVDSTRMGLQGQSWGGYQTAQLITMTTRYKAAMAGAPVSNMFSAYGGIRWGAGISRMFQYEKTQSRIGYTIWERPDLYTLNSPVFGLPKVTTPLLIMSNDNDGAVPWYQGIELYMGLRRLNKPVWMLNYNDDEHNLTQLANKRDLSIRMRQFFDYYLMGAPAPSWMFEGVPALNKGKNFGLGLENSGN